MTEEVFDALAKPIVLGNKYGYSTSANGIGSVVVGAATKITKTGKVTLGVESRRTFCYGKPYESWGERADTVSVQSYHLFPV
jgi:hypothetical protein